MDAKHRLLLRQFASSQDPQDAVAFANSSLKVFSETPSIWVCGMMDNMDPSAVVPASGGELYGFCKIFYSSEAAHQFAYEWILQRIKSRSETSAHEERISRIWTERLSKLEEDKKAAIAYYNREWINGYTVAIRELRFHEDLPNEPPTKMYDERN